MLPARRRLRRVFKAQQALVAAGSTHPVPVGLSLACSYKRMIAAPLRLVERHLASDFATLDAHDVCMALARCALNLTQRAELPPAFRGRLDRPLLLWRRGLARLVEPSGTAAVLQYFWQLADRREPLPALSDLVAVDTRLLQAAVAEACDSTKGRQAYCCLVCLSWNCPFGLRKTVSEALRNAQG